MSASITATMTASTGSASATTASTGTDSTTASTTDETGCEPFCETGIDPKEDVPGAVCGESNYSLDTVIPNVLLLLDASGSMVNTGLYWDHDDDINTPDESRWFSLYNVVDFVTSTFETTINLGLQFFPEIGDPKDCGIAATPEVGCGPMNAMAIMSALPPQNAYNELWTNPTPTAEALQLAHDYLQTLDPNIPAAVVLVTDGIPSNATCPGNTYPIAIAIVSAAFQNDNVPTYLVGIDISAGVAPDFNDLADAGGVPKMGPEKFYNSKNEIELQDALAAIAGQVQSCIAPLDPPPENPDMVQVQLDGQVVPKVTDCANEDGWVYVNPNGPYDAIELCGSYCTDFKDDGGEIVALYGCPPEG